MGGGLPSKKTKQKLLIMGVFIRVLLSSATRMFLAKTRRLSLIVVFSADRGGVRGWTYVLWLHFQHPIK